MAKYLTKNLPVDARKIIRVGASQGYFQLEDDSVVNCKELKAQVDVGDYLIHENGAPTSVMTAEQFELSVFEVPEDLNPLYVESLIKETDFVEAGPLTLCVLTLKDGRKVTGYDNAIYGDEDERRELAYHDAFNTLIRHEMYLLQGLQAIANGGSDD
ncbi:hypothetical protein ACEZSR_004026 [Vibrio parahaemolyticus]|nr:hypothetical protein [Vibrio parahaemolyticus]